MKKAKPWLVLILVFIAGFAGGVVTTRAVVRRVIQVAIDHPNAVQARVERTLDARLRLDREQRQQVHEYVNHAHDEIRSLRSKFQPEFVSILNELSTNIDSTLTPEQRLRFEKLKEEKRHLWQPRAD